MPARYSHFLDGSNGTKDRAEPDRQALSDKVDHVNDICGILQILFGTNVWRRNHGLRHLVRKVLGRFGQKIVDFCGRVWRSRRRDVNPC